MTHHGKALALRALRAVCGLVFGMAFTNSSCCRRFGLLWTKSSIPTWR